MWDTIELVVHQAGGNGRGVVASHQQPIDHGLARGTGG
jgi:hypothetical protein